MSEWIGVDLDGTLAHYDEWRGIDHIGDPIAPMIERVQAWLADGYTVKIFTVRMADPKARDTNAARRHIEAWCEKHIGQKLEITNVKDFGMMELWDDRAVQVVPNTGQVLGRSTRGLE